MCQFDDPPVIILPIAPNGTTGQGGDYSAYAENTVDYFVHDIAVYIASFRFKILFTLTISIFIFTPGGPIKTVPQFYFCDNFRKCTPILTIFSLLEQEIHAA